MDIGLLAHGAPRLHPDLLAEVQERVHEGGGDRREREAVGEREGGREEERAVLLVLCDVNRRVVVNDLRHIVRRPEAVEGCARRDAGSTCVSDGIRGGMGHENTDGMNWLNQTFV